MLLNSVRKIYEACRVTPGEKVTVISDTAKDGRLVDAFVLTGHALGLDTTLLLTKARPGPGDLAPHVESFLLTSDVVFDLDSQSWMYSATLKRVLAQGTRVLQVLATPRSLIARPPDAAAAARVRTAVGWLDKADALRITSELGTDLVVPRGGRPGFPQDGVADEPGTWDSCALQMANIYPIEGGAEGTVVLNGTVTFGKNILILDEPVRLSVAKGRITDVETRTEVGRNLSDWLKSFKDPNCYVVSHVGFGCDHRAKLADRDHAAFESYLGGVIIAFGSNIVPNFGGVNRAPSHFDSVLLGANFLVDDTMLIEGGRFTAASQIMD